MNQDSHIIFLLLGGNRGNREEFLRQARQEVSASIGEIRKYSAVFETEPWGFHDEMPFLNQAVEIASTLSPKSILKEIHRIERMMGRERADIGYLSRTIDIDIIFYDSLTEVTDSLTIPHPRMHLRRFVLVPMNEIAGNHVHPLFQLTVSELLEHCVDTSTVTRLLNEDVFSDTDRFHV